MLVTPAPTRIWDGETGVKGLKCVLRKVARVDGKISPPEVEYE